ncbi:MAG: DMT family transporter [Oscillospiraceae bacterium]|nr:DMT family transporter [Oscillospiraceae bacterium]
MILLSQKLNNKLQHTGIVAGIAFVCCALWGSAFSGVKIGYSEMQMTSDDWASQMLFAGIRFFFAGIMALIAGSILQKKLLLPDRRSIPAIGIISLFQTILQYFFYYIGLAHTTGVKASVLVSANVFAAILIAGAVGQERLTIRKLTGCVIGFAGIVLVNCFSETVDCNLNLNFLGDGFILLCTIASGCSSVCMKKYTAKGENPVLLSGWQFTFGGAVMALVGMLAGGSLHLTGKAILILGYLAFVSACAYSLWAVLLQHNPVSKVTVFGFLNPVCGVMISSIILHERGLFNWQGITALILVCAGIITVNLEKSEKNYKL